MSDVAFDMKDFRRALGQFPTGVTVVTTLNEGKEPVGVTASSFNSVSIDPPLILWSIDKGAHSLGAFQKAEYFAVNVLERDQIDISNRFASRGEDKFKGISIHQGEGGSPLLENAAAQFECKTWQIYEGGDHLIMVGEVIKYSYQDNALPLVFSRGSYAVSAQHPITAPTLAKEQAGPFVGDYLLYLLRETYNLYTANLYPKIKQQCGVTPEEWRVLLGLADKEIMDDKSLSVLVMQPLVSLHQTLEWMEEKGMLHQSDRSKLRLTDQGRELATELQVLAKQDEAEVMSALADDCSAQLKDSLRRIIEKQVNG